MCLGVPAKVIEVKGDHAIVDVNGLKTEISIILTPEVKPGDYVIVHAGFAISKIDEKEAEEMLKLLNEVLALSRAK